MTICDTLPDVPKAISVRLDDDALRALHLLERTGLSQSEAVRAALIAAAKRAKRPSAIAAEVAALQADPEDRAEMAAIAAMMEAISAPW